MGSRSPDRKLIDLGLQGGGAHGAFTWGVLDRLLADETIEIDGVSGTSAGAMNAVVLADGLARGGRDGARERLALFWKRVSEAARFSPIQRTPLDRLLGRWTLDFSPGFLALDLASRLVSPYEFNPLDYNPLREIVAEVVDFDRVRTCEAVQVFVTATHVPTGRPRTFAGREITLEAVMASACLPFLFHAVEIDGEPYWDGGFMGNPVLQPLVERTRARDIVVVQINPLVRPGTPKTARDILNRMNEISFNAALLNGIRTILLLKELAGEAGYADERLSSLMLHRIHAEEEMRELGISSKMNAEWAFLKHLHDIGWRAADTFLAHHRDDLGHRSTYPLEHVLWGLDHVMRAAAEAASAGERETDNRKAAP
ncbi:MAG: patatin-like phospholipase family protein [Elioraea sp.]|nr:patatin-like phospholipase family protein [Elioraea sp.]